MASWVVVSGNKYDLSRTSYLTYFGRKIDAALNAGSQADGEAIFKALFKFNQFIERVTDLELGFRSPEEYLRFVDFADDGVPLFSLIKHDWRCFYRLTGNTFTATKIERMPPNLRNVEEDRHRSSFSLPAR